MILKGSWHPADSSARYPAQLQLDSEGEFQLSYEGSSTPLSGQAQQLQFSQRIGNIPRKITLPDQSLFESTDNNAIDDWLAAAKHSDASALWMNTLESRWRWIALALIGTLLIGAATVFWGLPWASNKIAHQLPMEANRAIAEGTLSTLDQFFLKPSQLNKQQQNTVQANFEKALSAVQSQGFKYKLHFRDLPEMPNAFALPSGDVVVTDKLVELVTSADELNSILLHEIGHVEHRHGMRQVIQSSVITLALVMVTGDATATDGWTTALPAFLLQSKYSRSFETEADIFAFEHMMKLGIDPALFGKAIQRITGDAKGDDSQKSMGMKAEQALEYISSHPNSDKRATLSEAYSKRYQEQRNHPSQE